MKICIFYRSLNQGGVQRMMVNFANHMAEKGYLVTLVLIRKEGVFLNLVDTRVDVIGLEKQGYLSLLPQLTRLLKTGKFDLVFTATPSLNALVILARKFSRSKSKVIISERSSTLQELKGTAFGLYKMSFMLVPILYRFADAIVAVSNGVADHLAQFACINRAGISVIYNPAFEEQFEEHISMPVEEEWLQIRNRVPVIISAGRLTHQKNYKLLIDAFSLLLKRRELRLVIVGDGSLKSELLAYIASLDLSTNIKLIGFKLNPISYISKANVFVLCSLWEGFGNILVDALASGTTIVSTDCKSGPAEILENGKYGYLLKTFNAEDMANAIEEALNNPMDKFLMLERARSFSKKEVMAKYEHLIFNLLKS